MPGERRRGGRLVLEGLTKLYAGVTAVNSLDLAVEAAEFLTLLGPSGSGKSTTLMMVAGFTTPSRGRILLNGNSIGGLAPERRNIGVVFQNYALFPHMTVFENVGFPLRMRRQPRAAIEERVTTALRLVQLGGLGDRMPRQLSGGQQQRVALARSLVFNPDLLLMDEPLGALDKNLREQMQFELKRLHRELGMTILYVTHDQQEALTMSDRVALLNNGAIEQLGHAEQLYEHPANRFVAEFIGESNIIEGRLENTAGGNAGWFLTANGVRLPVLLDGGANCSERQLLVLRPEKLSLTAPGADAGSARAITCRVVELVYVGDFTRYRVEIDTGLVLTVKVQNNGNAGRAREGEPVCLVYDPADARVMPV
jgi:putative spermidine/putrescine transport system ATP-binding protein